MPLRAFKPMLEWLEPRLLLSVTSGLLDTHALTDSIVQFHSAPSFELAPLPDGSPAFVSRGLGYQFQFTSQQTTLHLAAPPDQVAADPTGAAADGLAVTMRWLGGRADAAVSGQNLLSRVSNYFVGSDPADWRIGVPNYERLFYDDAYTGIDLAFYGHAGELEYDWIVAAGADPGRIAMVFDGADALAINDQGQLVLSTSRGDLFHRAPVLYQMIDGQRVAVAGSFEIRGDGTVGFEVGSYDAAHELVIDPRLVYSRPLVGSDIEIAHAVALDDEGNAYVTGFTESLNFPIVGNVFQPVAGPTAQGRLIASEAFVTKINSLGVVEWSTFFGGSAFDSGNAIAVAESGEIWVAGSTSSTDLPIVAGIQTALAGSGTFDAFVARISEEGSALLYSTYLGGAGNDHTSDIALGPDGSVYLAGDTDSPDFPVELPLFNHQGEVDAFISTLSPTGAALVFSTYLGTSESDFAGGIDVDNAGNIYVVGAANEASLFPEVNGLFSLPPAGVNDNDAFLTRIAHDFSGLVYSTRLGGPHLPGFERLGGDFARDVVVDDSGIAVVVGETGSFLFPTTSNALRPISPAIGDLSIIGTGNVSDAFVTVLDTNAAGLNSLLYSSYLGGNLGFDRANAVAMDELGDIYITGITDSSDFHVSFDALDNELAESQLGVGDTFIMRLDWRRDGNDALIYSSYQGTTTFDEGHGIAVTPDGEAVVVGRAGIDGLTNATVNRYNLRETRAIFGTLGFPAWVDETFIERITVSANVPQGADPDDFWGLIQWDDDEISGEFNKLPLPPDDNMAIFGSHTYFQPGAYPITITMVDDGASDGFQPSSIANATRLSGDQHGPVIAADPVTGNLFMVAFTAGPFPDPGLLTTSVSEDGGLTWRRGGNLSAGERSFATGYDALFTADGTLYVAHLTPGETVLTIEKSLDGGKTFTGTPFELVVGQAGPTLELPTVALAADPTNGGGFWVVYDDNALAEIRVAFFSDLPEGLTLHTHEFISTAQAGVDAHSPDIAEGPDGRLLVVWQEDDSAAGTTRLMSRRASFLDAVTIASWDVGGALDPFLLNPAVGFDNSGGPRDGYAYVAYSAPSSGPIIFTGDDVYLSTSTSGGESWGERVRVNNDLTREDQHRPALAVDDVTGLVAVGWYDGRDNLGDEEFLAYYMAASNDGGRSFVNNVPLTPNELTTRNELGSSLLIRDRTAVAAWGDSTNVPDNRSEGDLEVAVSVVGIVDVLAPPLTIVPAAFEVVEGTLADVVVATFTTLDRVRLPEDFEAVILWGDGSSSAGAVSFVGVVDDEILFSVSGSHAYADEGAYTMVVLVSDTVTGELFTAVSNGSRTAGSQANPTVAYDPSNPRRVFLAAQNHALSNGLVISTSDDIGGSWSNGLIGGFDDPLHPLLLAEPSAVFDRFGNLFLVALGNDVEDSLTLKAIVMMSTDGGNTFSVLDVIDATDARRPTVAVGPGANGQGDHVWVTFGAGEPTTTAGAQLGIWGMTVNGLGQFGTVTFGAVPTLPTQAPSGVTDLAIGPGGEVLVAYVDGLLGGGPASVQVQNLTNLSTIPIVVTPINISAHPQDNPFLVQLLRGIEPGISLAWDLSDGPHFGRAYLVYADSATGNEEVDIWLRYSDDVGLSWSAPVGVAVGGGTDFHPSVAVDPATGNVAVGYFSSQVGDVGKAAYTVVVSGPGGESFREGVSFPETDLLKPNIDFNGSELFPPLLFGDYTEIDFSGGLIQAVWPDNSRLIYENPDATNLEIASGKVGIATVQAVPLVGDAFDFEVTEGEEFAEIIVIFEDPDPDPQQLSDYSATIDWGDGETTQGTIVALVTGGYSVLGTHQYDDVGTYDIEVEVRGRGTRAVATPRATVIDSVLIPRPLELRVVEQVPFVEVVAQMIDTDFASRAEDFTATIHWGDGTVSDGTLVASGITLQGRLYDIIGSHTYLTESEFEARIVIVENGGQQTLVMTSTINAGDPPISVAEVAVVGVLAGVPSGTIEVGRNLIIGPGVIDTDTDSYSATVDWGDGTTNQADVALTTNQGNGLPQPLGGELEMANEETMLSDGATVTVLAGHQYNNPGTYVVTVTLRDDSGQEVTSTGIAHVAADVTHAMSVNLGGLVFNPATQQMAGTIDLFNSSGVNVAGPIRVVFDDLLPGVQVETDLATPVNGDPYLSFGESILFSGNALPPLPVAFTVPSPDTMVGYSPRVYAGAPFLGSSLDPSTQSQSTAPQVAGFERNIGQVDESVLFLSRGPGYGMFLMEDGATIRLDGVAAPDQPGQPDGSSALRMRWVGGQAAAQVVGIDRQAGVSHYLIGDDQARWVTDVPTFSKVRYAGVYDGIDLELHNSTGRLQYDWYLAAGADPDQIALAFDGADDVRIDERGALHITAGGATVIHHAPVLYQHAGGSITIIEGGYALRPDGLVGYAVGAYNEAQPLVIDPVLEYASYFGGRLREDGVDVAVDAAGNTYIVGNTTSPDLPIFDAIDDEHDADLDLGHAFPDVFITKLDPAGRVVFSTYLGGGAGFDEARGLALDGAGNIVVVGATDSRRFPTTTDAFQPYFNGSGDGFITKLDPGGSNIVYSSFIGGGFSDETTDVAIDAAGAMYIIGHTRSRRFFPTTPGAFQTAHADPGAFPFPDDVAAAADGFVAKVAPDGTLAYSTLLGATGGLFGDFLAAVAVDDAGRAHVVGRSDADGLPTPGGAQPTREGGFDAYLAIVNEDGTGLVRATYLGGAMDDEARGVAVDDADRTIVVGWTESPDFDTLQSLQLYGGGRDGFITTFTPDGAMQRSTFLGADGDDEAAALAIDAGGHITIVGLAGSDAFPILSAVQPTFGGGPSDGFVTRFDPTLSTVLHSTFLGGNDMDRLDGVFVEPDGTATVIGTTISDNLRTVNPTQPTIGPRFSTLTTDVLLARIAPTGQGVVTVSTQPLAGREGEAVDGLVATFTSTSSETAGDFTAAIDWGDGTITAGSVVQTGGGRFNVLGSHVYESFGQYPVFVSIGQADGSVSTATSTAAVGATPGFVDYRITIDTSSLAGTDGVLSLQFNPAALGRGADGLATLTGFTAGGGMLMGGAVLEGGAAGDLAGGVTIGNGDQLNRLTQRLNFGGAIEFLLRLSGDMIADPQGGLYASTFAVQLLGDSGATPLLTAHESGAVLTLDVLTSGETRAHSHADATGRRAARATAGRFAAIEDAPIEGVTLAVQAEEGVPFSQAVATFTDANPFGAADEFTAMIDWGDGSAPTPGVVAQTGPGQFSVTGSHTYAAIGQFPLAVSIVSAGGATTITQAQTGIAGLQAARLQFVGGDPLAIGSADFDHDGHLDVVVPRFNNAGVAINDVAILFGRGDGTFDDPVFVASPRPGRLAVADFNGDGHADFAVTTTGQVNVHLGTGGRAFGAAISTALNAVSLITATDANRDGRADLLAVTFVSGVGFSLVPLVGNGAGGFAAGAAVALPASPVIADVDGDGNLDLVTATTAGTSQTLAIRRGNGNATFAAPVNRTVPVQGIIAFGDITGDGIVDLVVGSPGLVHVMPGDAAGAYGPPVSAPARDDRNLVTLVDFDADGDLDVLVLESGNTAVEPETLGGAGVLLNTGGVLAPMTAFAAPARSQAATFGDFNEDGAPDIAAIEVVPGNQRNGLVSVALGNGDGTIVAPFRYDLNRSGFANGTALFVAAADLDGDGDDDVVINTTGSTRRVTSILNHGGSLSDAIDSRLFNSTVNSVTLGDLNKDAVPDLIVTTAPTIGANPPTQGIHIMLGLGGGAFGPAAFHSPVTNPLTPSTSHTLSDVAIADVTGDGNVDLIVGNGPHSALMRGNGDGTFQSPQILVIGSGVPSVSAVVLADFNSDGRLDLATHGISVALGRSDGSFDSPQVFDTGGGDVDLLAVDVNGDGKTDLLSARSANIINPLGSVNVLIGVGDGTFEPVRKYAEGRDYRGLAAADLNADGRPDLVAIGGVAEPATFGVVGITVLHNNGDGTYAQPLRYEPGALGASGLAVGFFDDDLIPDIYVSNGDDSTLSILTSRTGASGVRVRNAPIAAAAFDLNPVAGLAFTAVVARFDDANTLAALGDHVALIDWGDGQTSAGAIIADPRGGFLVAGSHTYASAGPFNLTVTITDDAGGSAQGAAQALVSGTDGAIDAQPVVFNALAAVPVTTQVATFTDSDANGSVGDFRATIQWGDGQASEGVVVGQGAGFAVVGVHTYTGGGMFAVSVTISDIGGGGDSVVSTAIVAANTAPVAADDAYAVSEDRTLTVTAALGVLANDEDDDGDALTVTLVSDVSRGLLVLLPNGSFTYSPEADFNGTDGFTYSISDGRGGAVEASVTLAVGPVNDRPLAMDDSADTDEDVPVTIGVLDNDDDVDGDALTVIATTPPAHGSIVVNPDGTITYAPQADFNGQDTFTYTIHDGMRGVATAAVAITVRPVNDPPDAVEDTAATDEEMAVVIDVLANDGDAEGDALAIANVSDAVNGMVVLNGDQTITYTPFPGFHGVDSFDYTVADGAGGVAIATATVMVRPVNDRPVAAPDAYQTDEDVPLLASAVEGVLANDGDVDGDGLSAVLARNAAHGFVDLNADGSFTYTPDSQFHGVDTFDYLVADSAGGRSQIATVTIAVDFVNDDPVAGDDAAETGEDQPVMVDVLSNDGDADGDAISITDVTAPVGGAVVLNPDQSITYTPLPGFHGIDTFQYTLSDGRGGADTATVTLTVLEAPNAAPIARDDEATTAEDTVLVLSAASLLSNDTDAEGDALTLLSVRNGGRGSVVLQQGQAVFTPTPGASGLAWFSYVVSDSEGGTDSALVLIRIAAAANAAPNAGDDEAATDEDVPVPIDVLDNDDDADADPLSVGSFTQGANGTVTSDGVVLTYTPNPDFHGTDSFTYRASDGSLESIDAIVSVTIRPRNDAPVAVDDAYTVDEDDALDIPLPGLLGNDGDADGDPLSAALVAGPASGILSIDPLGSFTYTPNADFNGTDSFTYRANDGSADSAPATVTITVAAKNDAPEATDDAAATDEDTLLSMAAPGVLANDGDVDAGAILSVTAFDAVSSLGAAVQVNADGSFTFDPRVSPMLQALAAGQSAEDSFSYTVSDGQGGSAMATVRVAVQGRDELVPPRVDAVIVNGGAAQRSNVEQIEVRFSRDMNLAALIANGAIAAAVKLTTNAGAPIPLASNRYRYDSATFTLAIDLTTDGFGGSRTTALADGRYQLRLDTALITENGNPGNPLADGDGTTDGIHRFNFHRLLADFDGNATVAFADLTLFNQRYLSIAGQAKYDFAFDINGDGRIDQLDYQVVRMRIGRSLPPG